MEQINQMTTQAGMTDLIKALSPLQGVSVHHAIAFLQVCAHEGLGVREYADIAGVSQAVMVRYLLDLAQPEGVSPYTGARCSSSLPARRRMAALIVGT
jgi:hypothetical protein